MALEPAQRWPSKIDWRDKRFHRNDPRDKCKPPKNGQDVENFLNVLDSGYHTTRIINMVGRYASVFFHQLKPKAFQDMADAFWDAIRDERNVPSVRMSVAKNAIRILSSFYELARFVSEHKSPKIRDHLKNCVEAYFNSFGEDQYRELADICSMLIEPGKTKGTMYRAQRASALANIICTVVHVIVKCEVDTEDKDFNLYNMDEAKYQATQAELQIMMNEINDELKRRRLGKTC